MELYNIASFFSPELAAAVATFPRDLQPEIYAAYVGLFDTDMAWKKLELFSSVHENIRFFGRFPAWLRLASTQQSYYKFKYSLMRKMINTGLDEYIEYLGMPASRIQEDRVTWQISPECRHDLRRLYLIARVREEKKKSRERRYFANK